MAVPGQFHTHLDKGSYLAAPGEPDGTFMGALQAVARDREANWSAGDVAARMEFGLSCSYAHGTSAVRTHLDSVRRQAESRGRYSPNCANAGQAGSPFRPPVWCRRKST